MRTTNRKTMTSLFPAVAVAGAVMGAGVAGNLIGTYLNSAPVVGHIIAFDATRSDEAEPGRRLEVQRADGTGCVLDLNMVRRFGGSLVVETLAADSADGFRVHWAGKLTSDGAGDCGRDTNLIVGRRTLDLLASSAGGYGTGQDRAPVYALGFTR